MSSTIGFIGAGAMGGAVARRLATGGFDVRVFDLDDAALARCVDAGASAAASAVAAAAGADLVFTSLPLPEHVLGVWRELTGTLAIGAIGVDVSTIDPVTATALTAILGETEHDFVTCALGKTPQAAEVGEIPLFVGGPARAVRNLAPVFDRIGQTVYDFGSAESAAMFKLVSNLVGMTNVAVLAEGYVLARRAGIDPDLFARALHDTGAFSFQSDVRLPWIMANDYAARFDVRLAAKDVRLAVESAARWGIATPVAAQGLAQMLSAIAHGFGGEDVTCVAKVVDPAGDQLGRAGSS